MRKSFGFWAQTLMLAAMPLVACGENIAGGGSNTNTGSGNNAPPSDYPSGPYGVRQGAIIENLRFAGYLSERPDGGPLLDQTFDDDLSLAELRRLDYEFAIIAVAASWCVPCQLEAEVLPDKFRAWADAGGIVMSILVEEDQVGRPAARVHLDSWIDRYRMNYTMVHDPRGEFQRAIGIVEYPTNMLVELKTMRIEEIAFQADEEFLDFVDARLGTR